MTKLLIGVAAVSLGLGLNSAIAAPDAGPGQERQIVAQQDSSRADDTRRNRDSTQQGQDPSMQPGSTSQPSSAPDTSGSASAGTNGDTVKSMEPDTASQPGSQEDALRNRDSSKQHDRDDNTPPHK